MSASSLQHAEALPILHEAAVLYAAKFPEAAERALRARLQDEGKDREASEMLLEILHLADKRAEFEVAAARHADVFACEPPEWGFADPVRASGTFELAGTIDAPAHLEGLVPLARSRPAIAIDMSRVERIDFAFVPAFRDALRLFRHQGQRVILANIAEVHAALLQSFGPMENVVLLRRARTATMRAPGGPAMSRGPSSDPRATAA